ncbi:transcriptional regulator, LysR family [Methylobacterium sp. 4-46]|uniref:LysR family transcriptional regulator n=1 Tax=unclassified Methylobacterium TaxID=2615210 RepID=UPI000152C9D9|nr:MULTISPECIES: LysR family transcriptional regulator [Methylobacterium]ACA14972.1 transcriptional regulator, LysR family [Methylobacterium sp. 4-46]WFT80710.1 LysR family transcriptional regulator [Methylobacterium nodulans]
MPRSDLSDLVAFARVARHRSFRRAAAELGLSPSALSHALRDLEARLGARLLNRTTRSVAPTEAGAALLARLGPALDEIDRALGEVAASGGRLTGTLRLNAPRSACRLVLAPLAARFLSRHPGLRLEIACDDALADIVREGFDAGVRFGERVPRDMIAVPLGGRQRFAVVGSPAYLAARGLPATPEDLAGHACLRQRFAGGAVMRWEFERDGRALALDLDGPLILNEQELLLQAAVEGSGLAQVFEGYAAPFLAEGRLVRLLEPWCPSFPGFLLYHPSRRQPPPPLRAFLDFVRESAAA